MKLYEIVGFVVDCEVFCSDCCQDGETPVFLADADCLKCSQCGDTLDPEFDFHTFDLSRMSDVPYIAAFYNKGIDANLISRIFEIGFWQGQNKVLGHPFKLDETNLFDDAAFIKYESSREVLKLSKEIGALEGMINTYIACYKHGYNSKGKK